MSQNERDSFFLFGAFHSTFNVGRWVKWLMDNAPVHRFLQDLCGMPSVWYELCNFLESHGARLLQHTSWRAILTLTHGLYTGTEDRTASIDNASLFVATGRRIRQGMFSVETSQIQMAEDIDQARRGYLAEERIAHNVAMRWKYYDRILSGDLSYLWSHSCTCTIRSGETTSSDLPPPSPPAQRLPYLHNILCSEAQRYYLISVQLYGNTFERAFDLIDKKIQLGHSADKSKELLEQSTC